MVYYRRARNAGATYFFTVTVRDRRSTSIFGVESFRMIGRLIRAKEGLRIVSNKMLPEE